jgi:hypothetical protein
MTSNAPPASLCSPPSPPSAYSFTFDESVLLAEVEATLQLARIAVEGLYGEARVWLDTGYRVDRPARSIIVDAATPVGSALCDVFVVLALKEFGGRAMTVRRLAGTDGEVTP